MKAELYRRINNQQMLYGPSQHFLQKLVKRQVTLPKREMRGVKRSEGLKMKLQSCSTEWSTGQRCWQKWSEEGLGGKTRSLILACLSEHFLLSPWLPPHSPQSLGSLLFNLKILNASEEEPVRCHVFRKAPGTLRRAPGLLPSQGTNHAACFPNMG